MAITITISDELADAIDTAALGYDRNDPTTMEWAVDPISQLHALVVDARNDAAAAAAVRAAHAIAADWYAADIARLDRDARGRDAHADARAASAVVARNGYRCTRCGSITHDGDECPYAGASQ